MLAVIRGIGHITSPRTQPSFPKVFSMRLSSGVCHARFRVVFVSILALLSLAGVPDRASAATLTVCASGCAYSDLQLAINTALPGDTILLRAGETFIGNFVLPDKAGDGLPILIRSDAADSSLPPAGVRLVPPGYPGANTSLSALARLKGRGGIWKTTPVLQTAAGAHGYRLQFLDIDGIAQEGWGTLIEFGNNSDAQTTLDAVPYNTVLDRVFVHGHPTKGLKRCIALNGRSQEVLNSHVSGCAHFEIDSQAIAGFNGPGPFRIINNYLEAATENVLFGGADPKIPNLIPSDIEIKRNHFSKLLAWRSPILQPPSAAPGVTSIGGGGALGIGTHYFTVVAVLSSGGDDATSAESKEAAVSVRSAGSTVTLTWPSVAKAEKYRIYRGTSAGNQNRYLQTSGPVASFAYTGSGEITGNPPSQGKLWNVKNLLELKNAQRVAIDGNIFEYCWNASQKGYAVLFTPRNQNGNAPWAAVRDISFTNNIIRHVAGAIDILGADYAYPSQRTTRVMIRNNLAYDIGNTWGFEHFLLMTGAPDRVTVDHNTAYQQKIMVLADGDPITNFVLTNNVAPHNDYGIFGSGAGMGNGAIAEYFPSAIIRRNAIGGANASIYPPDNFYPDMTTFNAQFINVAASDFRLVAGSIFNNAGTDGKHLGIDFTALNAAMKGAPVDDGGGSGGGGGAVPFGGTAAALPGTIQAENFDTGGRDVAYRDTSSGNSGGKYRVNDDVDIESASDSGGGYDVGWAAAGEWLKYTVNVAAAGTYDLEVRVASAGTGGTFHLEADGVDLTGRLTVPSTGGWQSWATVRKAVTLKGGSQVWRLVMDTNGSNAAVGNFNYLRLSPRSGSTAYGGTPTSLPGTIQAENFDEGASGVAYLDTTSGNTGGKHRTTSVDIQSTTDSGGGFNLGWTAAGEWLKYTVDVGTAGTYDIDVRVASAGAGGAFHIEVDGVDRTGRLTVPNTGGWQAWTTVRKSGVSLSAGPHVLRLVMDTNGSSTGAVGNFNYVRLAGGALSAPFGGTRVALPGTIQVENFDDGGATRAYVDASSGNAGGEYRTTDVDIQRTSDGGSGYNVGWSSPGEWLNYSVSVATAGTYDLEVRVASPGSGGTFHIEVNGTNVTGPLSVPSTGGWQTWATVRKTGIALTAGTQVWRLVMDAKGGSTSVGNFNFIRVIGPR